VKVVNVPERTFDDRMAEAYRNKDTRPYLRRLSLALWLAKRQFRQIYADFPYRAQRWEAAQQAAVCSLMQHKAHESLVWLTERALPASQELEMSSRDLAQAGIYRDMGMAYSLMKLPSLAMEAFQQSLNSMADPKSTARAATLAQLGRLDMRQGRFADADEKYEAAQRGFDQRPSEDEDARKQELYATLHRIQNDIAWGRDDLAEQHLERVQELLVNFGSGSHRLKTRVLMLCVGRPWLAQLLFRTVTMRSG
jgi:tetratricopeptide (TPR) repeat protein